jgi:hypothetical protein
MINLKTAKALLITVPSALLAREPFAFNAQIGEGLANRPDPE